jgi:anti-sigma factor RsiW
MTTDDGEARGLTCREAISLLGEYLEGLLTPGQLAELGEHLAQCEPCQAYLKTYRRTRGLTIQEGRVEMPAEMRRRLGEFLVRRLSSGAG